MRFPKPVDTSSLNRIVLNCKKKSTLEAELVREFAIKVTALNLC